MATFLRQRLNVSVTTGAAALMTFYWDSTGAAQTAICTEGMARVRAFFNSAAAFFPSTMAVVWNPVFDEIEETTGALVGQVAGSLPAALTFTGATDNLPPQTQLLMRYSTNAFIGGRRVQGRTNVPFLQEGANGVGGAPTAAALSAFQTAANLLGTAVVTAVSQRVWHRPGGATPGLSTPVIARSISPEWAVLRSRR